ncbi:MAG: aminomethyl-transferring glycine dehydrogenase [Burkholderiales bacterium]|nr:aminomethyl-transferring glycine dehydrogenase [Burkholderiales bacterium]
MADPTLAELLGRSAFHARHLGPDAVAERAMLTALGVASRAELVDQTLPSSIRAAQPLELPPPVDEAAATAALRRIAGRNKVWRSYIGMGYAGSHLPPVIQRNVLENPGWYTAYTPYQAEISQGRLEALLAFQQMLIDLTGLPVANASLLDEATAAGEAMTLVRRAAKSKAEAFFVDAACHPHVLAVVRTRAKWMRIPLVVGDPARDLDPERVFGAHLQYPDTYGAIADWSGLIDRVHAAQGLVSIGTDLLALVLLEPPGALGADVAVGSAQRFGVPFGYGGPHAGFMAARDEIVRQMPGRIIGVARDAAGRTAYRMALQTREQHIRREKATSNICTSQVLLANIAAFYAIYHGPEGLRRIALRTHFMARLLARSVNMALAPESPAYFDTLTFKVGTTQSNVRSLAATRKINLRMIGEDRVGVTFDETTTIEDVVDVAWALTGHHVNVHERAQAIATAPEAIPPGLRRSDAILAHPVFNLHRTETGMMRYLKRLENRDFSLVHGMIPLGSCTMKLNAAAELAPITWPELANIHPFAPAAQARGYAELLGDVAGALAAITGLARMSFQPNSGANGEYAGLVTIRNYHAARGEAHRDVCLIPSSAHGTNPASAIMAGMQVVVVACDARGNVDVADLRAKIAAHRDRLAAMMITYPSTHGVFEAAVKEICDAVHAAGGQVYMDGANLNALAGLARPADFGADVCHINLHKTFCIPHGGGGPGMGPIGVAAHLAPHLPCHPVVPEDGLDPASGTVSSAPFGSPLIVAIAWMYLRMMGAEGIRKASEVAILSANYVAARLAPKYPILYRGASGRVAHECILDTRGFKEAYGASAEDIAKRLMDYGFHAPTVSFPVADTLMVEPTESESQAELDRFCDAMLAIHGELERIGRGDWPRDDNPLRNAPHTAAELAGEWTHPYSREEAAFPVAALRADKYWPPVKRVDQVYGDRHFFCGCPPPEDRAA